MRLFWLEIRVAGGNSDKKKPVVRGWGTQSLISMPDTTTDLFYRYYRKNSDVKACVNRLNKTIGKGWIYTVDTKGEKNNDVEVINVLNYDLKLMRPKKWGFKDLKNRIVRDVLIGWNAYIHILRNDGNKVIGFQPLDPRSIIVKADKYGDILGYVQTLNGNSIKFAKDEIIHFYEELDPDNEMIGMSRVESLITELLTDDEASLSNYYFFKNSSIPGQVIILDEQLSDSEQDLAVEQIRAQFGGTKNKHKLMALGWVKDIKKIQDSLSDMDFEIMRKFTTNRICATFDVPKTLLSYTDGVNYSNSNDQYKIFIQDTVIPWEETIEWWINQALVNLWFKSTIQFDSNHIDDFGWQVDIKVKQIDRWLITINEARKELGYEVYVWIPEADQPLISKNIDLLSDVWLSSIDPLNGWT